MAERRIAFTGGARGMGRTTATRLAAARPGDVAAAVMDPVSAKAGCVPGTCLDVNGGLRRQ